jgi:ribosomal protein L7/L12
LGLPPAAIIQRIYQAPVVLMEGLDHKDACEIHRVLDEAGLLVDLESEPVDVGAVCTLFDIAVHIQDIEDYTEVGARLAEFLGCQREEAERLLETPPGVVLGDVSEATVQALSWRLAGLGASVVPADKKQSVYDLFLLDRDPAVRSTVLRDLRASAEACGDPASGIILRNLSYDAAAAVWRRYQSTGAFRLINQAFEQWDIILVAMDSSAARLDALSVTAGIPRDVCPNLIDHLPLVVEEAVSDSALPKKLKAYAKAGLDTQATLTTLRALKLMVNNGPSTAALLKQPHKTQIDNQDHRLQNFPLVWPGVLYDLQARRLKQRLEASGYDVEMKEL